MKDILIEIDRLAADELERANKVHPMFASDHEGESVIREEMEEVIDSMKQVGEHFAKVWKAVKEDSQKDAADNVSLMRLYASCAAAELIQVIAMCDKFEKSQEGRR